MLHLVWLLMIPISLQRRHHKSTSLLSDDTNSDSRTSYRYPTRTSCKTTGKMEPQQNSRTASRKRSRETEETPPTTPTSVTAMVCTLTLLIVLSNIDVCV